jgi:uncharacterized protein (TIGR00255 family)
MTGFGSAASTEGGEQISVELRSVNGKFCEVKPRLPRELASLEADLVRLVKERVGRGNVDAMVRRSATAGSDVVPRIDEGLIAAYVGALKDAAQRAGIRDDVGLRDLLTLQGVVRLEERPPDLAAAGKALASAVSGAVSGLLSVRQREGAALEADLRARSERMRLLLGQLREAAPAAVATFRERLHTRIRELAPDISVDPARLEQEVVIFADRSDVAEELTRLAAHLDELERLFAQPGPVGRQLDFLLQEINREVNTTGSKSQSSDLARIVVELKTELERLREQVQNVE